MSAPCSSGREKTGVPKTLSTTTFAPAAWASSQTDVDQLLHRVARRLEEHRRSRLGQRLAPLVEVRPVDEDRLDPPPGQDLVEDDEARPEERPRRHDPVPVAEQRRQGHPHGRHAGPVAAGLGPLDLRDAVPEHPDRRVPVARVDEPVRLPLNAASAASADCRRTRTSGRSPRTSHRNRCAPSLPAPRWCPDAIRCLRRSPCTHGSPATFQPATARWCWASWGPRSPRSRCTTPSTRPQWPPRPRPWSAPRTDRGSRGAGPSPPGSRQLVDEAVVDAGLGTAATRRAPRPGPAIAGPATRRTTTRRGSARRRARLAGPAAGRSKPRSGSRHRRSS